MYTFYLIIGLIVLFIGGELIIRGAIPLAVRMKVSMVVVGLTVVSFATSAPELIVSVYSSLTGHSDIALGNVCLLYTSPSPRDQRGSGLPASG